MSMNKRVLALAVAGASALMLGGAFGLSTHTGRVEAAGAATIAVGCAQSSSPASIQFPTSATAPTLGVIDGVQAGVGSGATAITLNAINLLTPQTSLECAALIQDATGATAVAGEDANPNTVDGGNVIYTLANAGGRFVILDNLSSTISKPCGADAPGPTPPVAATAPGLESCEGAVAGGIAPNGYVTPNPDLVIRVGLAPGVPLNAFGTLSGIQGVNFGFALTATYQRYADLSAVVGSFGPSTNAATVNLGLLAPLYSLALAASPTTISANPASANTGGVAQGGNGGGATITASLYTVNTNPLVLGLGATGNIVIGGSGTVTAAGQVLSAGAEPGTVTFATSAGVFGAPAAAAASAQQTVSVACGVLPGSTLAFNPQTFSFGTFSFTGCTSASATLYGGGAAGQATVVATFTGAITGGQAQNAVMVAISPVANVVSLIRGCNEVITPASLAQNGPIGAYVATVSPANAVVSVWQFNNAAQAFGALYFSAAGAPTNGGSVGPNQSVFVCVSGAAGVPNGAY